jgi:uncharacterized cupredoxin-like copper-binding protein
MLAHRDIWISRPGNSDGMRQRLLNIFIVVAMALVMLLLFMLVGCENNRKERMTTTDVDTLNKSIAPSAHVDSSTLGNHTMHVNLTEYTIGMSTQIGSGPTVFRVMNAGRNKHNFRVEGNGTASQLTGDLEPGESEDLLIDLKPGTYQIYCPIDGHRGKGMARELTVTQ